MSDNEDDAYEPRDRASIQRVQLRDVQVERFEIGKLLSADFQIKDGPYDLFGAKCIWAVSPQLIFTYN